LLVGFDYYKRRLTDNGSGYVTGRYVTPQIAGVDFVDPVTHDTFRNVPVNKEYVDNLLAGSGQRTSNISNGSYSAYVSDVINFTPAFMAMASLRGDYLDSKGEATDPDDSYHQFVLSPKFGLVYQPVLNKVSLFANYMNAFVNVQPSRIYGDDGNPTGQVQSFKPEHANQLEFGVKTNLIADKLNITASYYDIKVGNRVYTDVKVLK
jgi:iron complex outermembrane receptor protein